MVYTNLEIIVYLNKEIKTKSLLSVLLPLEPRGTTVNGNHDDNCRIRVQDSRILICREKIEKLRNF